MVYTDVTASSGVDFRHETGAFGKKYLPETIGPGVVAFDADGDARLDLFFPNGQPWPGHEGESEGAALAHHHLYGAVGSFRFEDRSRRAGVAVSTYGMGGAAADPDADGDMDLLVTGVAPLLYFENQGDGTFVERAHEVGLDTAVWADGAGREHPSWSVSAAFLDYDRDGWLDLFVTTYVRWSEEIDVFTTLDGMTKAFTTPELYPGDTNRLYRNRAGKGFQDVTREAGVETPQGKALAVAVRDIDGDGAPDLAIANDSQPNQLLLNRGGRFEDVALEAGVAYDPTGRARAGMGIDVVDLDGDGRSTMVIGNFSNESLSFYRETSEGRFTDEAARANLAKPTFLPLTFGLLFVDFDLDGALDLAAANGHIEPAIRRVQPAVTYAERPQLFWNRGDDVFEDVTDRAGEGFRRPLVARGLAAADLDEDGDPDLVLTTCGGPAVLLRCDRRGEAAGRHFVRVRLEGRPPNRAALGARLTGLAGGRRMVREIRTGSSYLSQSELAATFGLGERTVLDRLVVRWPSGRTTEHEHLEADRLHVIREDAAP